MVDWNQIFEKVAKEYRPLFEALRLYDLGVPEEEILRVLGIEKEERKIYNLF